MDAELSPLVLVAPMRGVLIPIEKVPDPVFAEKMVGDGVSIDPLEGRLRAPCDGRVTHIHASSHAITIRTAHDLEILLHIGIDTVALKGEGFTPRVKMGDTVLAGDELIRFDLKYVAENAPCLLSQIIVSTMVMVKRIETVEERVLEVGDTIFTIYPRLKETPSSGESTGELLTSKPVALPILTGLHARPASILVKHARNFTSKIEIRLDEKIANAKSITSIMKLDTVFGDELTICAAGDDAAEAISCLEKEIALGLGDEAHVPAVLKEDPAPQDASVKTRIPDILKGIPAAPGLAIGTLYVLEEQEFSFTEEGQGADEETARLKKAISKAIDDLQDLGTTLAQTNPAQAVIFSAHQELLEDPELIESVIALILSGKSAESAWKSGYEQQTHELSLLKSTVLAERAADLQDVGQRVLLVLLGEEDTLTAFPVGCIIAAKDLSPSLTATLDPSVVHGFCTTLGGATSHVAILASSLGIPAIAGINEAILSLATGTEVVLDGNKGFLKANPDKAYVAGIKEKQKAFQIQQEKNLAVCHEPATTTDCHRLEIVANVGSPKDAKDITSFGGEGIGLLRTEFLFLKRLTAPSEDEQYLAYKEVLDAVEPKDKVIIRTLDVGGDKPLPYIPLPHEDNPFLGKRGIRVCLAKTDIFRTQLRALLRASTHGHLHIMFPMISDIEEWHAACSMLEQERQKLCVEPVPTGMMIEVPSAAILADVFAPEVDFFSIGTNDLTQYTLAIDRGHPTLAPRADALHPAVLNLIKKTVDAAHQHNKWVGICGGIGQDPVAIPLLLGLGVDELSVSTPSIPMVKAAIRALSRNNCTALATQALMCKTTQEVRSLAEA